MVTVVGKGVRTVTPLDVLAWLFVHILGPAVVILLIWGTWRRLQTDPSERSRRRWRSRKQIQDSLDSDPPSPTEGKRDRP